MAHIVCFLALLCFASCVAEDAVAELGFEDPQLQQDSLPWLKKLQDEEESTKTWDFVDYLYRFLKSENGMVHHEPKETERQDEQEKNRREVDIGITTRRAGCRVFFWKTWTSC